MKECYKEAHVTSSLQRLAYFFQDDQSSQQHDAVVLHVTLNVFDWVENMRKSPRYAPNHGTESKPMEWKTFLEKEWTMKRPDRDLKYQNSTKLDFYS